MSIIKRCCNKAGNDDALAKKLSVLYTVSSCKNPAAAEHDGPLLSKMRPVLSCRTPTLMSQLFALLVFLPRGSFASFTTAVDLGPAGSFALLASTALTNVGPSTITGDVGSSPGVMAAGEPVGATLVGINHGTDGVSAAAQAHLLGVYATLSALPSNPVISELASTTMYPGVVSCSDYFTLTGAFTLDGEVRLGS
jgi:hypothetical protein